MTTRHAAKSAALATRLGALAWAAPQVIAHRSARMAQAGAQPSARDRAEMQRMVHEKTAAFGASWLAMSGSAMLAQQRFASLWFAAWTTPFARPGAARFATAWQGAMLDMLSRGIAPIQRTAVANSKRLAVNRRRGGSR